MKAFKIKSISKDDTLVLKAVGILLIALHNYFRWVKPITGENEFGMSVGYIQNGFHFITGNPLEFVNVFFNFLGHYGVQIFILLSAYGLTKVYINKQEKWKHIVVKRFVKLYPSLLLATFAMVLFHVAAHANLPSKKLLVSYLAQLSLLSTLIPGKALSAVGPWWFYSMIFQFYLLFPGLLFLFKRFGVKAFVIISVISYGLIIFLNPHLRSINLNILHTALGHLPEFCFGIWLASKKEIRINWPIYTLALAVFILSNFFREAWYFSHLSVIIVLLPVLQWLTTKIKSKGFAKRFFTFIGLVSVYIFAIHGFLRWEFVALANFLNHPIAEFLVGIMFLVFTTGFAWLLFKVENNLRQWIANEPKGKHIFRFIVIFVLMAGLVFSVKSCESINYAKKQKQKQNKKLTATVGFKKVLDFENYKATDHPIIDTVSFSGNKSCLITPEREYGPIIKIDLSEVSLENAKEIKLSCAVHKTNNKLNEVHAVMELRKTKNKTRLAWKNKKFVNAKFNGDWSNSSFSFSIEPEIMRSDAFIKFYIWNNSSQNLIIDDFGVEIIYEE